MSAIATPSPQPACCGRTTASGAIVRRSDQILATLCLFAILVCGGYLAVHCRHDITGSLQAVNLTAVRYETVGMLSVP
jgi:hypothetical protein